MLHPHIKCEQCGKLSLPARSDLSPSTDALHWCSARCRSERIAFGADAVDERIAFKVARQRERMAEGGE